MNFPFKERKKFLPISCALSFLKEKYGSEMFLVAALPCSSMNVCLAPVGAVNFGSASLKMAFREKDGGILFLLI